MQTSETHYLRRERAFVLGLSGLIALTLAHFSHTDLQLIELFQRPFRPVASTTPPVLYAPEAYRVAIPALINLISRLRPALDELTVLAALNVVWLWSSLVLLYVLEVSDRRIVRADRATRYMHLALVYLFAFTALEWMVQYQRPETGPTTLYVLAAAWCLRKKQWWPVLLGLTAIQGFVRSDVPMFLGLGTAVVGVVNTDTRQDNRKQLIVLGVAMAFIAGSVQAYLQLVRFPHLSYSPDTPVIQFWNNLHFHSFSNGMLALLPIALAIGCGVSFGCFSRLDTMDRIALAAAVLYFPLWFTIGSLAEPRIFIPFLVLLSPVAARCTACSLGVLGTETMRADPAGDQ